MRPTQLCAQPTASPTSVASPIAYIWQGSKYQMKLKSGDMVLAQDTAVVHKTYNSKHKTWRVNCKEVVLEAKAGGCRRRGVLQSYMQPQETRWIVCIGCSTTIVYIFGYTTVGTLLAYDTVHTACGRACGKPGNQGSSNLPDSSLQSNATNPELKKKNTVSHMLSLKYNRDIWDLSLIVKVFLASKDMAYWTHNDLRRSKYYAY